MPTAYNSSCLSALVPCEAAVTAGESVVVVSHEVTWSASFASGTQPSNFVAFDFVDGVDAFFFFLGLLLGFWRCSCWFRWFGFFFLWRLCFWLLLVLLLRLLVLLLSCLLSWTFMPSPLPLVSLADCSASRCILAR